MNKKFFKGIFLIAIIAGSGIRSYNTVYAQSVPLMFNQPDTITEDQILYNGKLWRNRYSIVKGDQFLFSKDFLEGSLSINGNFYKKVLVNYDIYNDEILTPKDHGIIVQLNKEMVDSFTMIMGGKTYRFLNVQEDSLPLIKGYITVLYKGKSALYVKYKKEIEALAVDDKYDLFYRTYRVYFLKEGNIYQISGKSDLLKVLEKDKNPIKAFMKNNRIKVSKKDPESFVPVITYYDSLNR